MPRPFCKPFEAARVRRRARDHGLTSLDVMGAVAGRRTRGRRRGWSSRGLTSLVNPFAKRSLPSSTAPAGLAGVGSGVELQDVAGRRAHGRRRRRGVVIVVELQDVRR